MSGSSRAGWPRPSFRQLLLLAFLLVATLLGTVALRGQVTLERLLERSRAGAERTLQLSGQSERLGEQGLTMERAARQYLVLGDPALRATFERAADDAQGHVKALAAATRTPDLINAWQEQRAAIESQLAAAPVMAATRDRDLALAFRELDTLHAQVAELVRGVTEQGNAELQAQLETGRLALRRLVAGSLAVAVALALGLALWLARPLRRVEAAIVGLGENRLDERIDIRGPSDVRQIGRQLDWLRQRLAGVDADKARFLRHVSHELKTPLAALREGVALLQDGVAGPLSADQREVARILHDNSATLQRRIEDLLRFNAAAFAAQRLVRKPCDVAALVAGLVQQQQLLWRGRGLGVKVQADLQTHLQAHVQAQSQAHSQAHLQAHPQTHLQTHAQTHAQTQLQTHLQSTGGPLVADIDADLLGSAIGNLLSNAIRYSPPGGSILIDLQRMGDAGDGLRIEVLDQGPGVDEADRARIFEPFYRGQTQPEDGQLPGTGIGLSIVAETVAAHGGSVALLPSERGARFCIELPHAFAD